MIDPDTECVTTSKPLHPRGISVGYHKPQLLHRIVWVAEIGALAEGTRLKKTCPTPGCISSAHRVVF